MSRRSDPALLVVLAGVVAAFHVGKLPTAIPVLRESLGLTLVQAGFMLSLVQLGGVLFGLVVGLAADGLGLRRTMIAGLLLLALASTAGGVVRTPNALMAMRGMEGIGFLLASMPAPSLIRRLVQADRVQRALGLWGAYMPFGTAVALLCGPPVMHLVGWRGWWWLLAALSAAMALLLWMRVPSDAGARRVSVGEGWPARLATTLRAPGPWLIALSFAVYSAQWLAVIGFLPSMYAQVGLRATAAGAATAVAALVNMSGNIASGRLLQHGWRPAHLLRIGFVAMALGGLIAFARLPVANPAVEAAVRYGAVLMFSAVGGLIPGTLFSLAVRVAPGETTVSTTVGWMQQWSSVGQFAGPPLVAALAAHVGDWSWSGVVTAACACAGLMLSARIATLVRARS